LRRDLPEGDTAGGVTGGQVLSIGAIDEQVELFLGPDRRVV